MNGKGFGRRWGYRFTCFAALWMAMSADAAYADGGITFEIGRRSDDFRWNLAQIGGSPDVLSELTWNLNEMREARIEGFLSRGNWRFAMRFARATVEEGTNQDSDYNGNGRTEEFSRSNNRGGGNAEDLGIQLGYEIELNSVESPAFLQLTPTVGYNRLQQNLTMTEGCQTIASGILVGPPCAPFAGLQSTYDTGWNTASVGLELLAGPKAGFVALRLQYEAFLNAQYDAVADWNLRSDFQHPVSYRHMADGAGYRMSVGLEFAVAGPLVVTATYSRMSLTTDPGTDITYLNDNDPSTPETVTTTLNEAIWDTDSYLLGIGTRFR